MRYIILLLSMLLWSGCSLHHKEEPSSKKKIKVVVLNIDQQINSDAKDANIGYAIAQLLSSRLVQQKHIEVIQRLEKPTFLDEQRLYEIAKKHGVDRGEADYIVTGVITHTSTRRVDYPSRQRSEGGSSDSWSEYRACLSGTVKLFKLPSYVIQKSLEFKNICVRKNQKNYREMLTQTAPKVVDSIMPQLRKSLR